MTTRSVLAALAIAGLVGACATVPPADRAATATPPIAADAALRRTEVDAALDEGNIERYMRVVQEFRETTQFIIISHSKRTMSVADVLYGVSMAPGGSSRVVSQRIKDLELEDV